MSVLIGLMFAGAQAQAQAAVHTSVWPYSRCVFHSVALKATPIALLHANEVSTDIEFMFPTIFEHKLGIWTLLALFGHTYTFYE